MAETIKSIRVIPFSGKDQDWNRWSKTFLATATAKGYKEVILPKDPKKVADADLNILVYKDLILSCQEDITFGIIDESVSTEFPDGDARLAWKTYKRGISQRQVQQRYKQRLSFTNSKWPVQMKTQTHG